MMTQQYPSRHSKHNLFVSSHRHAFLISLPIYLQILCFHSAKCRCYMQNLTTRISTPGKMSEYIISVPQT